MNKTSQPSKHFCCQTSRTEGIMLSREKRRSLSPRREGRPAKLVVSLDLLCCTLAKSRFAISYSITGTASHPLRHKLGAHLFGEMQWRFIIARLGQSQRGIQSAAQMVAEERAVCNIRHHLSEYGRPEIFSISKFARTLWTHRWIKHPYLRQTRGIDIYSFTVNRF